MNALTMNHPKTKGLSGTSEGAKKGWETRHGLQAHADELSDAAHRATGDVPEHASNRGTMLHERHQRAADAHRQAEGAQTGAAIAHLKAGDYESAKKATESAIQHANIGKYHAGQAMLGHPVGNAAGNAAG